MIKKEMLETILLQKYLVFHLSYWKPSFSFVVNVVYERKTKNNQNKNHTKCNLINARLYLVKK